MTRHVEPYGGDPKKAIKARGYPLLPGRAGKPDRKIQKVRLIKKQQKHLMVQLGGKNCWAEPDSNHHMAIYKNSAGKVHFEVTSLLEAARRQSCGEPVVRRDIGDGWQFVFSLGKGEMLALPGQEGVCSYWVVTSVWSDGTIEHVFHTVAGKEVKKEYKTPNVLLKNNYYKISIDPIGRARDAHD
ncbi:MAG: hypothetical protein HQL73_10755 [Magnetococcales bacterium]|nr:hypothetical protein [Magnetococcales bacterium]